MGRGVAVSNHRHPPRPNHRHLQRRDLYLRVAEETGQDLTTDAQVLARLPGRWPGWLAGAFTAAELRALQAVAGQERQRPVPRAHLAHGDLDATHIWIDEHGRYAGIIDFGEMRGADRHLDLGHFLLHDRTARSVPLFEDFLAGYAQTPHWPRITAS